MTRNLLRWTLRPALAVSLLAALTSAGCDAASPSTDEAPPSPVARGAVPEGPHPGQGEMDFSDPTLDAEPLEDRAMALLGGFEGALAQGLPDIRAALDAATTYVEQSMAEAEQVGDALRQIKASATEEQRDEWVARVNARYADAVGDWRRTLARFEKHASDAEIVELNALVKRLAAPMQLP